MEDDIPKILSEELRETRRLANAAEKTAVAAEATAREAMGKADAAWEMVMITRNQVKEELDYLKKPLWKKWFGAE
jgi:hypothetical protein